MINRSQWGLYIGYQVQWAETSVKQKAEKTITSYLTETGTSQEEVISVF